MDTLRTAVIFVIGFALGAAMIHSRTASAQGSGTVRIQEVSPGSMGGAMVIGGVVGFSCAGDGGSVRCFVASK